MTRTCPNTSAAEVNLAESGYWILLKSGAKFDYLHPGNSGFTIDDIAHALSNACRFGGHCSRFYSVAQHSVYVSQILPRELALTGLLHDASEAFMVDVPRPLKRLLPDYRALEGRVHEAVAKRFGLVYPYVAEIHLADNTMLATEREHLMPQSEPWADMPDPIEMVLELMSPGQAKHAFLARYRELTR